MKQLKLILILLVIGTVFMLCGCNKDEVAMYDMLSESYNHEQYIVTGVYGSNHTKTNEDGTSLLDSAYNDLNYTIQVNNSDSDNPYKRMTFTGVINGKKLDSPIDVIKYNGKSYCSINYLDLIKPIFVIDDIRENSETLQILSEMRETVLSDIDYLELKGSGFSVYNKDGSSFSGVPSMCEIRAYYLGIINAPSINNKSLAKYIMNGFRDYSPNCVTKTDNGYTLETNALFGEAVLPYAYAHKSEIYSAYTEYVTDINLSNIAPNLVLSEEDFNTNIDDQYNTIINEYGRLINDNKLIKVSTEKHNNTYKNIFSRMDCFEDAVTQEYAEDNIVPENVDIFVPEKTITEDEFKELFEQTKEKLNPTVGLEFYRNSWTENGADLPGDVFEINGEIFRIVLNIKASAVTANGKKRNYNKFPYSVDGSLSCITYVLRDSNESIYVPLRATAEFFGETVKWNEISETASIVRDDTEIPMDGILLSNANSDLHDLYYARIREFEKLGYKVEYTELETDYENYEDYKTYKITITK